MAYLHYEHLDEIPLDLRNAVELDGDSFKVEVVQKGPAVKIVSDLNLMNLDLTTKNNNQHASLVRLWTAIRLASRGYHCVYLEDWGGEAEYPEQWCKENCKGDHQVCSAPSGALSGAFERQEDAVLFKMFFF